MKKTFTVAVILGALFVGGCTSDAAVVNENLAKEADNFNVLRRTVFYNGITNEYILEITGYCSVDMTDPSRYGITCKIGNGYKKHLLGKSDNVTMFSEQIDANAVSKNHYKVVFKPTTILPQPEIR